jgi:hypothetical protein
VVVEVLVLWVATVAVKLAAMVGPVSQTRSPEARSLAQVVAAVKATQQMEPEVLAVAVTRALRARLARQTRVVVAVVQHLVLLAVLVAPEL